jgi:DNA polymerase V
LPQHSETYTQLLPVPTSDTFEIVNAAVTALQQIYKEGFHYKKSGVILSEISQTEYVQQFLFDNIPNRPERRELMKAIDAINQNYGANKIYIGASGGDTPTWQNKSENRSSNYLTDLNSILTVKI